MFAPAVTGTKTASLAPSGFDVDADGKADPGDKIRYTVAISASGDRSRDRRPLRRHAGCQHDARPRLHRRLAARDQRDLRLGRQHDADQLGDRRRLQRATRCAASPATTRSTAARSPASARRRRRRTARRHGGTRHDSATAARCVLNADGTFVYNPAAGFEGTDSFWYTLTSPQRRRRHRQRAGDDQRRRRERDGVVRHCGGRRHRPPGQPDRRWTVSGAINNGAGTNPAAGDTIFLFEGAHALTATLTLLGTQKLIGQDTTATLANLGAPAPQSWQCLSGCEQPDGHGRQRHQPRGRAHARLGQHARRASRSATRRRRLPGRRASARSACATSSSTRNGSGLCITTSGTLATTPRSPASRR